MRLVEVRLLEGPNVYRLEPVAKIEVAVGRRRTWYGVREPGRHAVVRLGATVPRSAWPPPVRSMASWVRRLRGVAGPTEASAGPIRAHRSSDPGHWILEFPYAGLERAQAIAEGGAELALRGIDPERSKASAAHGGRLLDRLERRVREAADDPPAWIRDAERRIPVVSITGTNGKSTTTRLVTHILRLAEGRVGTTTSDGVYVDEALVDPGDWTGPGGAAEVLRRDDVDVAVLETARGGILLRGVGYESNEASVLTNVSSDHLDLQGVHTLPELAEVKATVCRMTRPDGWVVLNADDRYVAAVARGLRARVAWFSVARTPPARVRRAVIGGGRAYVVRDAALVELEGDRVRPIANVDDVPITFGGFARHNVANALAASGAARALGATLEQVAAGLRDFRPSSDLSPGRLNVFRVGASLVVVDFAHNEAGLNAVLDVAEGLASTEGAADRLPITVVVGTAGDRPDDTLRGLGRIAARRADRVAIKETRKYLRGRTAASVLGELREGIAEVLGREAARAVNVHESEPAALRAELARSEPGLIVLLCHEDRDAVFETLQELGGVAFA
ncbi:MAG TPA: Mur ligase family protein [Candidatus Limnocylindrales bacterium]